MASRRPLRLHSAFGAGGLALLAVGLVSVAPPTSGPAPAARTPAEAVESVVVRRMDLDTTVLAGGDLVPARQTSVTCEVEDPDPVTDGGGGSGTIVLSLVANGATVKKGDVLCVLDSSRFVERLRREQIDTETARTEYRRVELTLDVARAALREYREGTVPQRLKDFETRTAMLDSDFERQRQYVAWADRMLEKGYLSHAPVLSARQALGRIAHDRSVAATESRVFRLLTAPKEIRQFESEIEKSEATLGYQSMKLKSHEERLAALRKQADKYNIRAPHDGMVVYAPIFSWTVGPLQPGIAVYQDEELFLLPDLSSMEAEVAIHESMRSRVRVGTPAEVTIPALPGRTFSGKIASIDQIPRENFKAWENTLYFFARVRLDETPAGLLPFMSAVARFDTGRVEDALVIPAEAMLVVDGRTCCDVVGPGGAERRPITIRRGTTEFLEVIDGLEEGEQVVLHPRTEIRRDGA